MCSNTVRIHYVFYFVKSFLINKKKSAYCADFNHFYSLKNISIFYANVFYILTPMLSPSLPLDSSIRATSFFISIIIVEPPNSKSPFSSPLVKVYS